MQQEVLFALQQGKLHLKIIRQPHMVPVVTMPFDSVLEEDTINLVATESISIAPLRTFSKEKDAIYKVWIHAVDSPSLGASTVTGHVRQDTIVG